MPFLFQLSVWRKKNKSIEYLPRIRQSWSQKQQKKDTFWFLDDQARRGHVCVYRTCIVSKGVVVDFLLQLLLYCCVCVRARFTYRTIFVPCLPSCVPSLILPYFSWPFSACSRCWQMDPFSRLPLSCRARLTAPRERQMRESSNYSLVERAAVGESFRAVHRQEAIYSRIKIFWRQVPIPSLGGTFEDPTAFVVE